MRNTAQQISKLTDQQIIKKEQEYAAIYLYTELCIGLRIENIRQPRFVFSILNFIKKLRKNGINT